MCRNALRCSWPSNFPAMANQNHYNQPFFITEKTSNNAFNFAERSNPKIFVPSLKTGSVQDVTLGKEIVFESLNDEGQLCSCRGLEHFIHTTVPPTIKGQLDIPVYIFDNHNHAFYFWHLEKRQGHISAPALLIHIDQHKDTRQPESFLTAEESQDLQKVFTYTNTVLNVGNFIPPAIKTGFIEEVIFLDSQYSLEQFDFAKLEHPNIILDIDLDFFAPESDYIGNDLKLKVIEKIFPQAKVVTICTSPFFIEQERALFWLNQLKPFCVS